MTSRGAYTLIEILIVLALLSIFMAIAIPSLGIINNFKEKQELNELKRDLIFLRNKAITENCYYEVNIDLKKNSYRLGITQHQSSIKSKVFESGLKFIKHGETTADLLRFSPSGSPSKAGSFVVEKRNGDRYKFSIAVTSGKVNIILVK